MSFKSANFSTNVLGICSHLACKLCSSKLFSSDIANIITLSVLISHELACEHATEHLEQPFADYHYTSDLFYCYPLYGGFNYLSHPKQ